MNFCPYSRHLLFELGEIWCGISEQGPVEHLHVSWHSAQGMP